MPRVFRQAVVACVVVLACAAGAGGAVAAPAGEVFQYRVAELAIESDLRPEASLDDDALVAEWTGPDGAQVRIPAFWDGGRTWRVRFAPARPGRWTYRLLAPAEGGAATLGQGPLDVKPAAGENLLHRHGGFLKVGPGGRHLTFTDGTPFFWLGDTWWFCPSDLVPFDRSNRPDVASMYKTLIDTRAAQGFSVVHMAFLGKIEAGGGVSGAYADLFDGRIVPEYWQTVDRYLDYANARGLIPVIGMGFHAGLNGPTLQQLQRLWRYVLARYGAHAVTFLICGEYNLASVVDKDGRRTFGQVDEQRVAKILDLGQFIRDRDPYQRAMTVHPWYYLGDQRQAWDRPWYDFIMVQGGHDPKGPPATFYQDLHRRTPPKPLLEGECTYEGIHGMSDAVVRRNAYKAIQSGCFGYTYGAHGLWYPTQDAGDQTFKEWGTPIPWWEALAMPGAGQMRHLRAAYERVAWWRLEPVAPDRLSWLPDGAPRPEVYVKADGDDTIVVYVAAADRPLPALFLRLSGDGGSYVATFLDPRTGRATPAEAPLVAEQDRLRLPPPPDTQDWLMILNHR